MAVYKYQQFLERSTHPAFDQALGPGVLTPRSGIYRCRACGKSDVSTAGHPLPPQNHHQHNPPSPIQWQLIVSTH